MSNGHKYNFGNSPIPPWGHLLMSRGEMAEYLYQKIDKLTADQIVYYVYQSNHINRYFTEDYISIIEQSLFRITQLELIFKTNISKEIESKLKLKYPDNNYFANNGILLVLEKDINYEYDDNWQLTTPVAFLIFNRPDTTQKVFNAIREAKPPKLLVVADGARIDKEGEVELCQQTRAIIEQVDWDCEVLVNYSDVNLGCRKRVSSGLDWVFEQVEEAIVLEDDCLPHPTFFRYCQELLEKYRDDERIMMISGDNFQFGQKRTEYSYYFSRYGHIWGWASWRRAWIKNDDSMQLWQELRDNNWLKDVLGDDQGVAYWSRIFQSVYDGFNTWDYIWQYTLWLNSGLTILPNVNLISNIGFGSGTHTTNTKNNRVANMAVESLSFPLNHPPFIIRNTQADNFTQENIFSTPRPSTALTLNSQENKMSVNNILNLINNHEPISALNALSSMQENSYSLNYAKAVLLAKQGQIPEAINHLNLVLAHSPSHTKASHLKQELKKNLSDEQIISENSVTETVETLLTSNQIPQAFKILNEAKANKQPIQGLDYLRAKCFLQMKQPAAAIQSLYEELRYFPDNHQAKLLLEQLLQQYPQFVARKINDAEFQELYQAIQPYTMLSEARLYSLFQLVKKSALTI